MLGCPGPMALLGKCPELVHLEKCGTLWKLIAMKMAS